MAVDPRTKTGARRKSKLDISALYRAGVGVGRPPKYKDPKKLREKIQEFFDACYKENKPPTITGLALFCGFSSRQSFHDYGKKDNKEKVSDDKSQAAEFSYITRTAQLIVANYHEVRVATHDKPQGSIFMLKNFGFHDKTVVENIGEAAVKQVFEIGGKTIEF